MTRNPLILVTLALGLVLGGCSNRSIGNKIDDQFLEPNVANAISRSHPDLTGPTSHIVVTAYNGVILLAGQTPRADLKEKAAQVANGVQGVKKLHNELQVLLHSLGVRLVLVHGSRPQIEARLQARGLPPRYHRDLRITDSPTLECVIDAVGSLRIAIEARLSMDMAASPMQGARLRVASGNFVTARPIGVLDGVDYHHTGEVRRIDRKGIGRLLDERSIVLLSPLGYSPTGETHDEVGGQRQIGPRRTQLAHQALVFERRVAALHVGQHAVGT